MRLPALPDWPLRRSKRLVLAVVFLALFVDALLVTVIVPIAPFIEYLPQEQVVRGILFASKCIVQLLCDPFVRLVSARVGRSLPILLGNLIIISSSLMLAFVSSLHLVVIARAIQGIGSSCVAVGGMGLLADTYEIDEDRDQAVGKAMSGVALGIMLGPPIGGVLFSLDASNILPFCVLSTLALVDIVMCLLLDPAVKEIAPLFAPAHGRHTSTIYDEDASAAEDPSTHTDQIAKELMKERAEHRLSSRIWRVLTDIHVLVIFGCILLSAFSLSSLEPTLPFYWVFNDMTDSPFIVGLTFAVAASAFAITTPFVAWLGTRVPRFGLVIAGLIVLACGMASMAVPQMIAVTAGPLALVGIGMSLVEVSSLPMLALIVQKHHSGEYNLVFLLSEMSMTIGRISGALLSTTLTRNFTFLWTLVAFAILLAAYSPLLLIVRRSSREEVELNPFKDLHSKGKKNGLRANTTNAGEDDYESIMPQSPSSKVQAIFANGTGHNQQHDVEDDYDDDGYSGGSYRTGASVAPYIPSGDFDDGRSTRSSVYPTQSKMTMVEYVMQSHMLRAGSSYSTSLRGAQRSSFSKKSSPSSSKKEPLLGGTT